jgi:nucleoside-diphosphate-sugar epimerase
VVQELQQARHEVTGLARSEEAARKLKALGVAVLQGDLTDLESLRKGASESESVIHTGFIHDFSKFKENCEIDRKAIETLGFGLPDSRRPLIVTSAIGVLPAGKLVTEETMPLDPSPNPRAASEEAVRALLERGVNVSVVRLPPATHGEGDHGFVPSLIRIAREKGVSAYSGDGKNTWPAVHRSDAAKVYRLALEKGTQGAYYHAVAEEGVEFYKIADVIGKNLKVPVVSKTVQEAAAHFAWFAHFAAMNVSASSKRTQEKLGWEPVNLDLLTDIDHSGYFS